MPNPHAPAHGPILQFSTDAFEPHQRITAWRETFGRAIAKIEADPLEDVPFYAHMAMRPMGDVALAWGQSSLKRAARTRELVATDSNDSLTLQITNTDGFVSQLGRELDVPCGAGVLLSNVDPGSFLFKGRQSSMAIALPRASLGPFLHDPDAALVRPIRPDNPALRLLIGYLDMLERDPALASEEVLGLAAAHIQDLVSLALGATRDAAEVARTRGVRAARLHAARSFVLRHLGQEDLSAATVGAHLDVSARYVHMLFEGEGRSFTEFVLAERLARAHRMLQEARHAGKSISTIAFSLGFVDLSHFNRSFRRRYGCTPSEVRAAAAREA